MSCPKFKPTIGLVPVTSGFLGYDPEQDKVHEFPPLVGLTAELADGSRTEEEITALLAPLLPAESRAGLSAWFAEGYRSGLLGDWEPAPPLWLDADQLTQLARKLENRGRPELALECQKCAAEQAPGNADLWFRLGLMAQIAQRQEDSVAAYTRYLELKPDDAYTRHKLAALRGEPAPERVCNEGVAQEFDGFSSHYDTSMREKLKYEAPERMQEKLWQQIGLAGETDNRNGDAGNGKAGNGLAILDLGCGTGLNGMGLKPRAGYMAGIDLSPRMLALAKVRGIYDHLEESEIVGWLEHPVDNDHVPALFDLITACDCMEYFGDLMRVMQGVASRLQPGAWFGFTVERGESYPHTLTATGRYTHHERHIRQAAAAAGLEVRLLEEGFLREEAGAPVTGLYAVLHKPAA
jgi:predicted TPR repeat methyltransferase